MSQSSERVSAPARRRMSSERPSAPAWSIALRVLSAVAASALGFAGCGVGDPNYVPDPGTPVNLADLNSPPHCVGTCLPDFGSSRVDCSADDGLEFFPFDVLNGEPNASAGTPVITGFYSYTDETAEFIASGPGAYSTTQANYEPPSVEANGLCGPDNQIGTSWVHHLRGGLFREWGGGMGRRLLNFVTAYDSQAQAASPNPPTLCQAGPSREGDPAYCPDADPRIEDAVAGGAPASLRSDFYGMIADLRDWEGISFWARQGPNNTAGIRVYLGDRQLDEDIGFLEQRAKIEPMCHRARECGCRNHRPCTQGDGGLTQWFCWDPAETPSINTVRNEYLARGEQELFEDRYNLCGPSACDDQNDAFQAPDPAFATAANPTTPGTAQCLSYNLTNDLEDYFCYDPNNPASFPPDNPERCGDGWAKGVTLTNDWQFYKIPFTDLRQEGYGKEFQYLDLSKITLVRFTWMQGWVDVWLDDVRFYRQAGAAPAGAGAPAAP
jgi:hypothetical protein